MLSPWALAAANLSLDQPCQVTLPTFQVRPGDVRTTSGGVNIVVDQESWPYLAGAVVDLDASGKGFRFDNPNLKRAGSDSPPARPASSSERGRCLFAEQSSKYTVVFAASAERVQAIFVGWRQPGPLRTRVERNPFTGLYEVKASDAHA